MSVYTLLEILRIFRQYSLISWPHFWWLVLMTDNPARWDEADRCGVDDAVAISPGISTPGELNIRKLRPKCHYVQPRVMLNRKYERLTMIHFPFSSNTL